MHRDMLVCLMIGDLKLLPILIYKKIYIKLRDNKYDHLINKYSNNFFISSDTPVCKIYMVKVVAFYHCSLH